MQNEELVYQYQEAQGDDSKTEILGKLYKQNEGLIRKIAGRFSSYDDIDDLMQEGFFGLRTAADLYDPDRGANFASYAYQWIRQIMRRYVDNCGSSVRIPVHRRDSVYRYSRIVSEFEKSFGRGPSDQELMKLLDIDRYKLDQLKADNLSFRIKSLDEKIPGTEGSEITLQDTIADCNDDIENIIEIVDNERLALVLWEEVAELSDNEEQVIIKRFKDLLTLKETGEALGISTEKARLIQSKALGKLRKSQRLKIYKDDYISSRAYHGGLGSFNLTHTSITEKIALDLYEKGLSSYIRKLDKQIKATETKYGVKLDDEFRQMEIEKYKEENVLQKFVKQTW